MKKILIIGGLTLTLCGIVFCIVDCSCGKTRYHETTVIAHHYNPPWTEITTDSDGHTTSIYHSEQFTLITDSTDGQFDVTVSKAKYYYLTNGQYVTTIAREGAFTHIQWIPHIQ